MNTPTSIPHAFIRPILVGLLFSFTAVFLGEAAGLAFSRYKNQIQETFQEEIRSHKQDVFLREREIERAVSDTWLYAKRFHYHAMGLGALSIAMILALALTWVSDSVKRALSVALGAGAVLIPSGWFLMALKTSYMGTAAAKMSLQMLILCCVGLHILAIGGVCFIYLLWFFYKEDIPGIFNFLK